MHLENLIATGERTEYLLCQELQGHHALVGKTVDANCVTNLLFRYLESVRVTQGTNLASYIYVEHVKVVAKRMANEDDPILDHVEDLRVCALERGEVLSRGQGVQVRFLDARVLS